MNIQHTDTDKDIKIKKAKEKDYQEIYKLVKKAFSDYKKGKNNPDLEETPEDVLNDIKKNIVLVLKDSKKIVGTLRLVSNNEQEIYLKKFAISPDQQNQGYGSLLFNKAEQIAKKKNMKKIYLYSSTEELQLATFYKELGFCCEKINTDMGYKRGLWVKEI